MRKLMIAALFTAAFYACSDAGEGSDPTKDTTGTAKDTMTMTNSDGSTTHKDTSSYERMPNKTTGDSTGN